MSVKFKRNQVQDKVNGIIASCSDILEDYQNGDPDELYFTDKLDCIIRAAKEAKDLCYAIADEEE